MQDHDVDFPHLLHSVNATQVDIEFVKLAVPRFDKPRVALEVALVAEEPREKTFIPSSRKTLDDEHTPGIFELIDISSPESFTASKGDLFFYFLFLIFDIDFTPSTILKIQITLNLSVATHQINSIFLVQSKWRRSNSLIVFRFN